MITSDNCKALRLAIELHATHCRECSPEPSAWPECDSCGGQHRPLPERGIRETGEGRERVGCERTDGTLNIHPAADTCEVCAPSPHPTPRNEETRPTEDAQ